MSSSAKSGVPRGSTFTLRSCRERGANVANRPCTIPDYAYSTRAHAGEANFGSSAPQSALSNAEYGAASDAIAMP